MSRVISKYAVLRYVPNLEREEFINIGVVIHVPEYRLVKLKTSTNLRRLKSFDDELDIKFVSKILEGMEIEFDSSDIDGPSKTELDNPDLLEDLTRYYVNQFQFSEIGVFLIKDFEKDFDNLFNTYVYYEKQKKKRISEADVRRTLAQTFKSSRIYDALKIAPVLRGKYDEEIELDFGFDQDFVKAFSLEYSPTMASRAPSLAREWAFRYQEIKASYSEKFAPSFISFVHKPEHKNKHIDLALDILNSESKIFYEEEATTVARRFEEKIQEFNKRNRIMF